MNAVMTHEHVRPRPRWLSLALVVALLATTFAVWETVSASDAEASHFRSTQLAWEVVDTTSDGEVTVEFTSTVAARQAFYGGSPGTGDTVTPVRRIYFGDGASLGSLSHVVTVEDTTNDWILMEATFEHTYTERGEYTAYWSECCRLGSNNGHVNNSNDNTRIETFLDLSGDDDDPLPATNSPVSLISPILDCPLDAVCTFTVPSVDAQGGTLNWRFATSQEATGGSGFEQPGPPHADQAASIGSGSGQYSWDTTNADTAGGSNPTYYSTQVVVEKSIGGEVVATTAVDFFIRLGQVGGNQAPSFIAPTPADGTVIGVVPGAELTFDVAADDPDTGDQVSLSTLNAPAGTFTSSPGNPATGTFTWTPPDTSSRLLTLRAQDDSGLEATARSLQIIVADVANLALAPATAQAPVNTDHTVTATATSSGGTTLAGAVVEFEIVAGPNVGVVGTGTTDSNGEATFAYPGSTIGEDTVTATTAGPTDPVAATDVTVDWVDAVNPPDDGGDDGSTGYPLLNEEDERAVLEGTDPDEPTEDPDEPTEEPDEPTEEPDEPTEEPDEPTEDETEVLDDADEADDETEVLDDADEDDGEATPATPIVTQPSYTG